MKRLLISLTFLAAVVVSAVAPVKQASAIVGGEVANQAYYPWAVAFVHEATGQYAGWDVSSRTVCSGALVAPDLVLTSAHCGLPRDTIQVVIGRDNLTQVEGQKRHLPAAGDAHFRHPDYTYVDNNNDGIGDYAGPYDVMLVKLDSPSTLPTIPIAGPGASASWGVGDAARLYGYGLDPGYNVLLKRAPLVIKSFHANHHHMFAQGSGTSGCRKDSGGPLVTTTSFGAAVIGVYQSNGGDGFTAGACQKNSEQQFIKVASRGSVNNSPIYTWIMNFNIDSPEF